MSQKTNEYYIYELTIARMKSDATLCGLDIYDCTTNDLYFSYASFSICDLYQTFCIFALFRNLLKNKKKT